MVPVPSEEFQDAIRERRIHPSDECAGLILRRCHETSPWPTCRLRSRDHSLGYPHVVPLLGALREGITCDASSDGHHCRAGTREKRSVGAGILGSFDDRFEMGIDGVAAV